MNNTRDNCWQLTAIRWIKEFVELAGARMLPYASGVLGAVLPCLAHHDEPRKSILSLMGFLVADVASASGQL